jgi:hypothetical protein
VAEGTCRGSAQGPPLIVAKMPLIMLLFAAVLSLLPAVLGAAVLPKYELFQ